MPAKEPILEIPFSSTNRTEATRYVEQRNGAKEHIIYLAVRQPAAYAHGSRHIHPGLEFCPSARTFDKLEADDPLLEYGVPCPGWMVLVIFDPVRLGKHCLHGD
jgi:hypothetical protein